MSTSETNKNPTPTPEPIETVNCETCGTEMIKEYAIEYGGRYYCTDCCDENEIPLCDKERMKK